MSRSTRIYYVMKITHVCHFAIRLKDFLFSVPLHIHILHLNRNNGIIQHPELLEK